MRLSFPFRSFRQRYSGFAQVSVQDVVVRRFQENRADDGSFVQRLDLPSTDAVEALPWRYRGRVYGASAGVTRSWALADYLVRGSVAYNVSDNRSQALEKDFPSGEGEGDGEGSRDGDWDASRAAFEAFVIGRRERVSQLSLSGTFFQNAFVTFRDVATLDFPEDVRMGPQVSLSLSVGAPEIGAQNRFVGYSFSPSYAGRLGRTGYWWARLRIGARIDLSRGGDEAVGGKRWVDGIEVTFWDWCRPGSPGCSGACSACRFSKFRTTVDCDF